MVELGYLVLTSCLLNCCLKTILQLGCWFVYLKQSYSLTPSLWLPPLLFMLPLMDRETECFVLQILLLIQEASCGLRYNTLLFCCVVWNGAMNKKMLFVSLYFWVCVFSIWQVMFKWMSKEKADEMVHSHSTSWTSNTMCVHTQVCGEKTARDYHSLRV